MILDISFYFKFFFKMSQKLDLFNSEKIKHFELERIETLPTGYERQPKKGVKILFKKQNSKK